MKMRAPRGTSDVLPKDSYKWQYLESKFEVICKQFGYKEIRTPIFEHTELFERGVGETTDVVQKEMYTFTDKGGRSITLKPEGTASAVRSYIENKLYAEIQPTKVYYKTPCFRYERPQAGRYREFNQLGLEVFGSSDTSIDVEVMALVDKFFEEIGLKNIELRINSIGCPVCREAYNTKLKKYLEERLDKLCDTCNDRFNKNPMRILDCKVEECQKVLVDPPMMIDNLCEECEHDFNSVKGYLNDLEIEYIVDPKIVRGLDYYTKTAFEFISKDIGSQATICGGGRYDTLVESLGGQSTPAIGFAMGMERLLLTIENLGIEIEDIDNLDIYIVTIGEKANREAFKVLNKLRNEGIKADKDYLSKNIKGQFRYADKLGAKYTMILGEDELEKGVVSLKDMTTGEQREIGLEDISKEIKKGGK